ncbi:MAG: L,D-transpeptidase [Microgenomates group bacterium]
MHRILSILLLTAIIAIAVVYFYTPARSFLVYKFNLTDDAKTSCCKVADILSSTGDFEEEANIAVFNSQIVDYPKTSLAMTNSVDDQQTKVLGTTNASGEEKWIDVSLAEQKLRAYEGNRLVYEYLISSGLWNSTPRGTFSIWYKTRYQRMRGGSQELGTYYNLPNVPNNMFFYQGYALHGAYWHNNFGHPMSHGCVNEPLASAAQIFEWAGPVVPSNVNAVRATPDNPGTKVVVH